MTVRKTADGVRVRALVVAGPVAGLVVSLEARTSHAPRHAPHTSAAADQISHHHAAPVFCITSQTLIVGHLSPKTQTNYSQTDRWTG